MKRITILTLLILFNGCAVAPIESFFDGTYLVTKSDAIENLNSSETPEGFNISPAEAYNIATGGFPQKLPSAIYADKKNYYIIEYGFHVIPTSGYARMYGVRVNGKTGKTDAVMAQ